MHRSFSSLYRTCVSRSSFLRIPRLHFTTLPTRLNENNMLLFVQRLFPPYSRKVQVVLGANMIVFFSLTGVYLYFDNEETLLNEILRRFELGSPSSLECWDSVDSDQVRLIDREDTQQELTKLFRVPSSRTGQTRRQYVGYSLIIGACGTGKSTTVRNAIRSMKEPKGVIYFRVGPFDDGLYSLQKALGYRTVNDYWGRCLLLVRFVFSGFTDHTERLRIPDSPWYETKRILEVVADRYYSKHKRAPVLVIDIGDEAIENNSEFFEKFSSLVEDCSKTGRINTVCILRDYEAVRLWYYSNYDFHLSDLNSMEEIGDVSDKKAIAYCKNYFNVEEKQAKELVETVTGGRIIRLHQYGDSQTSLAEIRRILDTNIAVALNRIGVKPSHPAFRELLETGPSGGLPMHIAHQLLNKDNWLHLLKCGIVSFHPSFKYTFGNRRTELFFQGALKQKEAK